MPLDETQSELINARISVTLRQALDACAAAEGRSRSQMVRRMIEEGVEARRAKGRVGEGQ
jgi:metal-responsive CopG/Arc/MetJ family transcriptional regulator